ncbi:MAG: ATP-binding protein [Deltaproteobacteria bacterium]|nr:ATP-binding protein [Deltaproteobacteria bacterium]
MPYKPATGTAASAAVSRLNNRDYPFSAIVGQEPLKLALLINAISPGVRGVLIRGEKGTAKSTAVRALARLLPPIRTVVGCFYNCDPASPDHLLCDDCRERKRRKAPLIGELTGVPLVTLPLNATEDNLAGSIDFESTIQEGVRTFRPGLLAKAHRGILYVDEVNLLDDHLVDLLLSAASSGINLVEREGISNGHPSQFVLIGTMNPEEGELRPQLLDRFGLCVTVEAVTRSEQRVEIMKRHQAFLDDPEAFCGRWHKAEREQAQRVRNALQKRDGVCIAPDKISRIIKWCRDANAAGHRAEIAIESAARAIAAYQERSEVSDRDIDLAARLALPHRLRPERAQQPRPGASGASIREQPADLVPLSATVRSEPVGKPEGGGLGEKSEDRPDTGEDKPRKPRDQASGVSEEKPAALFAPLWPDGLELADPSEPIPLNIRDAFKRRVKYRQRSSGRRYAAPALSKRGRYVRATRERRLDDIALDATIRAAAPFQNRRDRSSLAISILPEDIREKVREQKQSALLILVVDASGSIGYRLMRETKGAVLYLLHDAYVKRDRVCLIAFRNDKAEVLLPPTSSIELAKKKLEDLPTGGKTPLCAGMLEGYNVIRSSLIRNQGILPLLVLITDGRANVSVDPDLSRAGKNTSLLYDELFAMAETIRNDARLRSIVIDVEGSVTGAFRMAERVAECMGAKYLVLDQIKAGAIVKAIRSEKDSPSRPLVGEIK